MGAADPRPTADEPAQPVAVAASPAQEPFLRYADAALDRACADLDGGSSAEQRALESLARAALLADPEHPFSALCANARAAGPAAELLAVLVACDLDAGRSLRAASLTGQSRPGPLTLGAASRLLGGAPACAAAAGPGSPLVRAAMIQTAAAGLWATTELHLSPAVVWALAGDPTPDPDLPVGIRSLPGRTDLDQGPDLVVVSGPDRARRRERGAEHCPAHSLLVTPLPADEAGWRALVREATLTGAAVVLELDDELPVAGRRWIDLATQVRWIVSSPHELPLGSLPQRPRVEVVAEDRVLDAEEWRAAFGEAPLTHRLHAHQAELVRAALPGVDGDLDAAVRRLLAGPLGRLADRVRPRKSWDDLVLSEEKTQQLRTVVGRHRHGSTVYDRWQVTTAAGRGVVALFTGPSGTGKTLAAEVIAHSLELDLYRIDLSTVVSKYIGETEQNLDRLFTAASAGDAVLFFDEADSVFGKRSEVRDARDRYANLETSYLLQRLEGYDGVVVLATNLPGNIDEAFLRRIHEVVHFTPPSAPERRAIWQRHLTDGAIPLGDVDVDQLAERFELTGGQIRNVVLAAAFRAADDGLPLSTTHLFPALAGELRKLGRLTKPEDFDVR